MCLRQQLRRLLRKPCDPVSLTFSSFQRQTVRRHSNQDCLVGEDVCRCRSQWELPRSPQRKVRVPAPCFLFAVRRTEQGGPLSKGVAQVCTDLSLGSAGPRSTPHDSQEVLTASLIPGGRFARDKIPLGTPMASLPPCSPWPGAADHVFGPGWPSSLCPSTSDQTGMYHHSPDGSPQPR